MFEKKILFSVFALLCLVYFYDWAFAGVYYREGVRLFNSAFIQGDVETYLRWYSDEIKNFPFLAWYFKLDTNNLSLVYFSWLQGILYQFNVNYILVTSVCFLLACRFINIILRLENRNTLYSSFAILSSFPMIIYMQTVTKEALLFLFLFMGFYGVYKRNSKILISAIFLLLVTRVYVALILIASLVIFKIYRSLSVKVRQRLVAVSLVALTFLPGLYFRLFNRFLTSPNAQSEFGISNYFIFSIKYPGLFLIWLPFKIAQNFAEPFVAFYHVPMVFLSLEVAKLLDVLTAVAMLFLIGIIWSLRHRLKSTQPLAIFLLVFSGIYLIVAASLPLVHFRYIITLLPVFGVIADLLRKPTPVGIYP